MGNTQENPPLKHGRQSALPLQHKLLEVSNWGGGGGQEGCKKEDLQVVTAPQLVDTLLSCISEL